MQELARDVRDRADAGMRRVHLLGVGLHVGHELVQVLGREILARQDQDRRACEQRDRLEILLGMIGELRIERHRGGVRAHVPGDQRIAVIGRARGARGRGGAAGADHVLDDDALSERLRHVSGDDARDDVGRTACRKRHDHGDAACRVGLSLRRRGEDAQRCKRYGTCARSERANGSHIVSPGTRCRPQGPAFSFHEAVTQVDSTSECGVPTQAVVNSRIR